MCGFYLQIHYLKLFSKWRVNFANKALNEEQWIVERKTYMMFVDSVTVGRKTKSSLSLNNTFLASLSN